MCLDLDANSKSIFFKKKQKTVPMVKIQCEYTQIHALHSKVFLKTMLSMYRYHKKFTWKCIL